MEDPKTEPDVEVVDSPSSSTENDLKDGNLAKVAGIDDDEEEFDLVSHSMYFLVLRASL
jgi:hypothetical protein